MLPILFPFAWTQRQVYWMALCFWMGAMQLGDAHTFEAVLVVVGYVLVGVLGVVLEYVARPTPEFWVSAWLEYVGVLTLSLPLWWRRLLPRGEGLGWPLAVMPLWLGRRLVAHAEVLNDGIIRLPGRPGRPAHFALVLGIEPRPHPDLLPLLLPQTIIQTRLGIFLRIRGRWSLHLQVRPFDGTALEIASGPAWSWVQHAMAPRMVLRRPALVLHGDSAEDLDAQAEAILMRFQQAGMRAWRQSAADARRLAAELWSDVGLTDKARTVQAQAHAGAAAGRYRPITVLAEVPPVLLRLEMDTTFVGAEDQTFNMIDDAAAVAVAGGHGWRSWGRPWSTRSTSWCRHDRHRATWWPITRSCSSGKVDPPQREHSPRQSPGGRPSNSWKAK